MFRLFKWTFVILYMCVYYSIVVVYLTHQTSPSSPFIIPLITKSRSLACKHKHCIYHNNNMRYTRMNLKINKNHRENVPDVAVTIQVNHRPIIIVGVYKINIRVQYTNRKHLEFIFFDILIIIIIYSIVLCTNYYNV